jgi:undecaprenyl pyrophosphate synthase
MCYALSTIRRNRSMEGIQFVIDDTGKKTYVLLDLSRWGEGWEDIHDILVSQSRRGEPTVSWEELKREMEQEEQKTSRV